MSLMIADIDESVAGDVAASLPGSVAVAAGDTGEVRAAFERTVALGRYSTPDEQAALVAWRLSAERSYATGGAFPFDGGLSAGPYAPPAP